MNLKPSLRFFHSPALRARTDKVLSNIDTGLDPVSQAEALSGVVLALTKAGLDYYFMKAIKDARLGFVARQSAQIGIGATTRLFGPILRSVIGTASPAQLRSISKHIHHLMA